MKPTGVNTKGESLLNLLGLKHKSNTKCMILITCGILMITCGALTMYYDPIRLFAAMHMRLSPNSLMFWLFKDPPLEVGISIYVYNVTNAEQFLAGKEKLKVDDVGPYTYQEVLHQENPVFNENGTLSFTSRRLITFRRDLSVGDVKTDRIISPNIPLLGISSFLKEKSMVANLVVAQIANLINAKPFLDLTVDEYLWGYDDKLVTLAHSALPNWINFPRFGIMDRLMALDNAGNNVTIKVNKEPVDSAMLDDNERRTPYTIMNFNGSPGLHDWGYHDAPSRNVTAPGNSRCNSIEGAYESGLFDPKMLEENATIYFFRRAFCRPVPMTVGRRLTRGHFDAVEVSVDQKFLALPKENPDNECYCNRPGTRCKHNGVSFLTPCYYGIPITISNPHFLHADPIFLEAIEGMQPEEAAHESTLFISENLGIPIDAKLRIQINLDVDTRLSSRCKPFNGLMLPLFWVELNTHKLSWMVYAAEYVIKYAVPIGTVLVTWLSIIFGSAIVAATMLVMLFARRDHHFEDLFDNIGYAPIKIIPVGATAKRLSLGMNKIVCEEQLLGGERD